MGRCQRDDQGAISKGKDIIPQKISPVLWRVCDECEEAEGSLEIDCQLIDCNAGKLWFYIGNNL